MQPSNIIVDLRLPNAADERKAKAFADVSILFGEDGILKIQGFSVIQSNGDHPRVAPPARKGKTRYFDVVSFTGKVRHRVESAILAEYERQTKEAEA